MAVARNRPARPRRKTPAAPGLRARRKSPARKPAAPAIRGPVDPATAYAVDLEAGRIPGSKLHRLAAVRHLTDLDNAGREGWAWDAAAVARLDRFFRALKHSKGEWAGRPIELEPWQLFKLGSVLAWKWRDGLRRYRRAYNEVPRKNGKSTIAAGLGLLLTFFDGEAGAEGYCAATKRDQARIVWEESARMVKKSGLSSRLRVLPGVGNISQAATASKLEPLGADADTLDGLNIHLGLIDEFHAHKTRAMIDVLEGALGARRQPLIWAITTAGVDRESVCYEWREYARRVLEGAVVDPEFFGFITGLDEGDDWKDPESWAKSNPNYGVSVSPSDMAALVRKAIESPAAQNAFRQKRLNEWVGQSDRWLDLSVWERNTTDPRLEGLAGRPAFVGVDMATTTDLAAAALIVPDGDRLAVRVCCWMPEEGIKAREDVDRVPYRQWARDGWLTLTPGNVIDDAYIERQILEWAEHYDLQRLGFDRYNATSLIVRLGVAGVECVPIGQGFLGMNAPTKYVEGALLSGRIAAGRNPVLRWMFDNMAVLRDPAGNVKPSKSNGKSRRRIDGLVALIIAADGVMRLEASSVASVYETRGLLELSFMDPFAEFD